MWMAVERIAAAEDYPDDEPLQEDGGLPDWAIAVVVIGLGSFAFVLVFGITVVSIHYRNRMTLVCTNPYILCCMITKIL